MMANILKILHPFIPFFTESVWATNKYDSVYKKELISSSWPNYKKFSKFNKNHVNINNVIQIISNIRTTKAELKITPKLYCDISFSERSKKLNLLINNNMNIIQQVGRVNNIIKKIQFDDKNSVDILVLKEKISLRFTENIDLLSQKERILNKIENIKKQINILTNKLKNSAYLKNAPEEIVKNDKILLKELTIEDEKLRSIVSSIK